MEKRQLLGLETTLPTRFVMSLFASLIARFMEFIEGQPVSVGMQNGRKLAKLHPFVDTLNANGPQMDIMAFQASKDPSCRRASGIQFICNCKNCTHL
ncbi:hypothetical protein HPP92_008213 [Vanilla planifolia]|uniref:Uncharacterized protein n=1 Tax=Vanilla planifolia TaxID=51239 RepID=A0A835R993_VANPL|nr:hypothetical protein HPP92_008213 [Vanilla planifolia]